MILHQRGYWTDPEAGVVIGKRGRPIRRVNGRGYGEVHSHGAFVGTVHRMIWEAANGPIPAGMEINHINGIKSDNRLANLEMVTPSENCLHAFRTGLSRAYGEFNGRAIGKRRRAMQSTGDTP